MFRFSFREKVEYYDPNAKQPNDRWVPARFLGIAWDSGDSLTFFIEAKSENRRPVVLIQSTVWSFREEHPEPFTSSGERSHNQTNVCQDILDGQNQHPTINNERNLIDYVDNFLTENDLDESHSNENADRNTDASQSEDATVQHENDEYYVIEEPPKIELTEDDLKKD